jgi:hypothetical protein
MHHRASLQALVRLQIGFPSSEKEILVSKKASVNVSNYDKRASNKQDNAKDRNRKLLAFL